MNFIDFKNKKILVTGASSGLGRATAILLSKLNAKVILSGRNEKELNNTLNQMDNKDNHKIIPFDINDYENYDKFLDKCTADNEKISGFVYSIGIIKLIPLRIMNETDIDEIFDSNFKSFLLLSSKLAKSIYSESLSIVAISSLTTHFPFQANTIYSASKGAMESAVLSMAIELAKKNARINTVIPSYVGSSFAEYVDKESLERLKELSLLNLPSADDVANAIVFLLSDRTKCMTGRAIYVDSGFLGQVS